MLRLELETYLSVESKKADIEKKIFNRLTGLYHDDRSSVISVDIEPVIKRVLRRSAILPTTSDEVVALIEAEERDLVAIATGEKTFVGASDFQKDYEARHQRIIEIASRVGFDYPIDAGTLWAWWRTIKEIRTHAERQVYKRERFAKLYEQLKSNERGGVIHASQVKGSASLKIAILEAQTSIAGRYESAVDRIHTVFHGYLREICGRHELPASEKEGMPALFARLHKFYGETIQPPDVARRIKKILRSCGGVVGSINEIRNSNTIAHPNSELIGKREAEFVIRLVDTLMGYIEDIEMSIP